MTTSSRSSPPPTVGDSHSVVECSLTTQDFDIAIRRYIEENKPDPISRRQLESWTLQWIQQEEHTTSEGGDNNGGSSQLLPDATHGLTGKLQINGTYVAVTLEIECAWKSSSPKSSSPTDNATPDDSKYGTLCYICRADSAKFLPLPSSTAKGENQMGTGGDGIGAVGDKASSSSSSSKSQQRIHQKMIQRLRQDSYISKYLLSSNSQHHAGAGGKNVDADENTNENNTSVLAHARIHNMKDTGSSTASGSKDSRNKKEVDISDVDLDAMIAQMNESAAKSNNNGSPESTLQLSKLEERVDVCEPVAEAVRRAVWSTSESSLDMVELILSLPSLPTTTTTTTTVAVTTPLANRAKLRLLEDAMLDACEREGEDGLLEDLSITNNEREKDDEECGGFVSSSSSVDRNNGNNHNHNQNHHRHNGGTTQTTTAAVAAAAEREEEGEGPKRKRGKKNKNKSR